MAGELERPVRDLFDALERMDVEGMEKTISEDAQSVDEISRRWLRSKDEIGSYLRELAGAVSDVHSELRDVHEQAWGDAGVVTCWLEPGLHDRRRRPARLGSNDVRSSTRRRRVADRALPLGPAARSIEGALLQF
jgi:SnoaL-like domain